jgi:hypothetical protein
VLRIPCSPGKWLAIGALVCRAIAAHCANITLIPDRDATLISAAPSNSLGGADAILAGTTQNGTPNRALLRFDVAASIPAGSKIIGTRLTVATTQQSTTAPAGVTYGVHRMLSAWGEGTNAPPGPAIGLGLPAENGDATWATRFFPTNAWAAPGGLQDTDFSSQVTSSVYIDTLGVFDFESTLEMSGDVQFWLDHPATNFGWMLKSESEDIYFTARKFASRENSDDSIAPQLSIDYIAPPQIGPPQFTNGAIEFSIEADAGGAYLVEGQSALGGTNAWLTVTNFGYLIAPATLTARIPTNSAPRFFRIRVD